MVNKTLTPEEMAGRIARYEGLQELQVQKNTPLPLEVMDIIYSRRLLPVITRDDVDSPFGRVAPIVGAAGITITYAVCPPNTGPSLHSHRRTFETFTVMQGTFRFTWGEEAEYDTILNRFDTISIPPEIHRAFRNISEEEGVLQVIISGGIHDSRDIVFPRRTTEEIRRRDPAYLTYLREKGGLDFEGA